MMSIRPIQSAPPARPGERKAGGFTLVEVLFVLVIVAVVALPMVTAFAPSQATAQAEEKQTVILNRARGTLNRVLTLEPDALSDAAGRSVSLRELFGSQSEADREVLLYRGSTYTPVVTVEDASGGTGGLYAVTVELDDVTLRTMVVEY